MPTKTKEEKSAVKAKRKPKLVYPVVTVNGVEIPEESLVITPDEMKSWLGWKEVADDDEDYTLVDVFGKRVRLNRNAGNRDFDRKLATGYAWEHLNGNWALNLETMVFGDRGNALSAQHRGAGLVLAEQIRSQNPEEHKALWGDGPVTMRGLVARGAKEIATVKRTLDNVRPRSLADVMFADSGTFDEVSPRERGAVCKIAEAAVKTLWERTRAYKDPHSPYRTHSESLKFIDRHPRVVDAVLVVWNAYRAGETADEKAENFRYAKGLIQPGHAAAAMYLMAFGKSDPEAYYENDRREESVLDDSLWGPAEEFWNQFVTDQKATSMLFHLQDAIRKVSEASPVGFSKERLALVAKAWRVFSVGERPTPKNLKLEFDEDELGFKSLRPDPDHCFGGIDLYETPAVKVKKEEKWDKPEIEDLEEDEPEKIDETDTLRTEGRTDDDYGFKTSLPMDVTGMKLPQILEAIRGIYLEEIVLFRRETGGWNAYAENAGIISKTCGVPKKKKDGISVVVIAPEEEEVILAKLTEANYAVVKLDRDAEGRITEYAETVNVATDGE